jgi:hypothetical protein
MQDCISKKRIYFNEFNIPTNNTVYLPFVSGLLRAYAEQFDVIKENYEFMPFLFMREPIEVILSKYDNPDIACFSSSLWNHQLCLKIAELVKMKFPNCLIVFGGPQVTQGPALYDKHWFIDVGVFGEGERFFKWLLEQRLAGLPIERKTYREEATVENLDDFPSPYSSGLYSYLIPLYKDIEFKAITESNRSCPFKCGFCFFGQSDLNKKIKHHSLEYLTQEMEWIANNGIKYVFCADANFGMFKRDIEIAKAFVEIKKKYGYPEKFRVCYGKNASDIIYQTAKVLSDSDLSKTVTLALQSVDETVLKNIGRSNIKSSAFIALQKKYTESNIPTYTEIILGLPGETIDTFLKGIEFVLQSSNDNQVFIYHCQILPNTPMAEPEYLKKFKIQTVKVPLAEVHGSIRDNRIEQEYESVVIACESMPNEDWKKCATLAWMIQLFYSLKVGHKIVRFLNNECGLQYTDFFLHLYNYDFKEIKYFKQRAEDVSSGMSRCRYDLKFGPIYYEPEELVFLYIGMDKETFYRNVLQATMDFLELKNAPYDLDKLKILFENQSREVSDPSDYISEEEYATKVVLHGRKSSLNKPIGFQLI